MKLRVGVGVTMVVVVALSLYGQEGEILRLPKMHCTAAGRLATCTVEDVGKDFRLRWTLYSQPQQATEGTSFTFEAPFEWTVVELAITDDNHDTQRLRAEVMRFHDKAIFRPYSQ